MSAFTTLRDFIRRGADERCPFCKETMVSPSGVKWHGEWVCTRCAPIVQTLIKLLPSLVGYSR